jgi:hypothetical protein
MNTRLWPLVSLSALFVCACASPPPPKEPLVVPSASAVPAPVAKAPGPDLSPVATPPNVLLRGTWRSPAQTQKAMETILGRSLEAFVQDKIGDPEVAELLDRTSPVHVALLTNTPTDGAAGPRTSGRRLFDHDEIAGAFSLPLRDFASARAFAERHATLEPMGPGIVQVRRTEIGDDDVRCALSVAVGSAPARLVCAERSLRLDAVVPWMTRNLPNEAPADEDWTFVGSGPVLRALVGGKGLDDALSSSPSAELSSGTAHLRDTLRLFLDDAKQVEFRAKLDPHDTRMSFALEVAGKSSPLTKLLFSGQPTGAPPELRRAPAEVTNVGFSGGADAEIGRKLLTDLLVHDFARHASHTHAQPYGDQAAMQRLIDRFPAFAPFWFVRGVAPRESVPRNEKWLARRVREERALLGWVGIGVAMPQADLYGYFADMLKVANGQAAKSSGSTRKPVGRTGAPPRGFPAGSKAIYLTSDHTDWTAGQRAGQALPVLNQTISVVFSPMAPGSDKTLVVIGVDTKDLAAHTKELLQDGTPDEALRTRAGQIEADFQGAVAGMSVIPSVIGDAVAASMGTTNPLRGVPNGGKTPVSMAIRPTKGGAELTAEIRLHEPSMADAGAAARFGLDILSMSGVMRRDRGLP